MEADIPTLINEQDVKAQIARSTYICYDTLYRSCRTSSVSFVGSPLAMQEMGYLKGSLKSWIQHSRYF